MNEVDSLKMEIINISCRCDRCQGEKLNELEKLIRKQIAQKIEADCRCNVATYENSKGTKTSLYCTCFANYYAAIARGKK